jgi:hypothetical protein
LEESLGEELVMGERRRGEVGETEACQFKSHQRKIVKQI